MLFPPPGGTPARRTGLWSAPRRRPPPGLQPGAEASVPAGVGCKSLCVPSSISGVTWSLSGWRRQCHHNRRAETQVPAKRPHRKVLWITHLRACQRDAAGRCLACLVSDMAARSSGDTAGTSSGRATYGIFAWSLRNGPADSGPHPLPVVRSSPHEACSTVQMPDPSCPEAAAAHWHLRYGLLGIPRLALCCFHRRAGLLSTLVQLLLLLLLP